MSKNMSLLENSSEYHWMDGFSAAVYDEMFDTDAIRGELKLRECGEKFEDSKIPPYCEMAVDAAAINFIADEDGMPKYAMPELIDFYDGYVTGRHNLYLLGVGVQNV